MKRITMGLAFAGWLCAGAWARPAVVTFSEGDLARVATGMCAVTPEAGKVGPAHRNSAGTMVYFVVNHREAVLYGTQPGTCNKLDDDVYDIWRDDSGNPSAQKVRKSEGDLILVGREVEMRGRRFDVERSGQYMVTSHGTTSTITAVNEAYRVLKSLDFDAQRIFVRKRALVLVGSNPATGQMEARPLEVVEGRIQEQAPIALGGLPAGLKVLDYSAGRSHAPGRHLVCHLQPWQWCFRHRPAPEARRQSGTVCRQRSDSRASLGRCGTVCRRPRRETGPKKLAARPLIPPRSIGGDIVTR